MSLLLKFKAEELDYLNYQLGLAQQKVNQSHNEPVYVQGDLKNDAIRLAMKITSLKNEMKSIQEFLYWRDS